MQDGVPPDLRYFLSLPVLSPACVGVVGTRSTASLTSLEVLAEPKTGDGKTGHLGVPLPHSL